MSRTGTVREIKYKDTGVDTQQEEQCMQSVKRWVKETFEFSAHSRVCLDVGYFANVIDIGQGIGVAIGTDGVGTKILIAEMLERYDTVGIDCIAMNVNDVICVGARPISMVDYVAVQKIRPNFIDELGIGLKEGARQSCISIPGGEIAQVREMIRGVHEDSGFDLVGTCIGLVTIDKINDGNNVQPGDVVVGLSSSGIHSNGFTLARRSLLEKGGLGLDEFIPSLGRTLGEELLEPTRIYVRDVLKVLESGIDVKALAHITSDGFMNLTRIAANVGFELDRIPDPPPIFTLIREKGGVPLEEMYTVYNMGIGFCLVLNPNDVEKTLSVLGPEVECSVIGTATDDPSRTVRLSKLGIEGVGNTFHRSGE